MSKKHKTYLSWLLVFLFAVFFVLYLKDNIDDFRKISISEPLLLTGLSASVLINVYATGKLMDILLRPLRVALTSSQSFGLMLLTRMTNLVLPGKLGFIVRAMYLKKNHDLKTGTFITTLGGAHVILFLISSFLGVAAATIIKLDGKDINLTIYLFLLSLFLAFLLVLTLPLKPKPTGSRIMKIYYSVLKDWRIVRSSKKGLLSSACWAVVAVLGVAGSLYYAFNSVGANVSFVEAVFFSSISLLSSILAITPAGLGITEGLIVLAASAIGIPVSISITASLLQRCVMFFSVLMLAPFFSRHLFSYSLVKLLAHIKKRSRT